MPKIFTTLDKIRPAYDMTYKIVMFLCKILLIADILIASYAVLGRFCQQWSRNYAFLSFLSVIKDPAWTEQVVLTCMSYMAVLSAALAIRTGAHIRMTAFDTYLPKNVVKALDILADVAVMVLGVIMVVEGWKYATTLGGKGFYESIPWLSRFWMYFPVPLAGVAMIVFEIEALYNHVKAFYVKEEEVKP
nr:TRAP transporter small permease subunit [uncultured Oscillibacter sp.]